MSERRSEEGGGATTAVAAATTTSSTSTTPAMAAPTPPRHNYANPNTPIASIKRPRSALNSNNNGTNNSTPSSRNSGAGGANTGSSDDAMLLTSPPTPSSSRYSNGDSSTSTGASAAAAAAGLSTPGPGLNGNNSSHHSTSSTRSSSMMMDADDSTSFAALTPMHPPKPVVGCAHHADTIAATDDSVEGKVNALFSPVLSFLANVSSSHAEEEEAAQHEANGDKTTTATVENLDDMTQPTASESTSASSSSNKSSPSNQSVGDAQENDDNNHEESLSCCESLQPMEEDHCQDDDEFNPWQFIKSLPDYPLVSHLCPKEYAPPSKSPHAPKCTLVLDLDETLVHCTVDPVPDADLQFPVQFHGTTYQVHVRLRPYLQQFLKRVHQHYEVIVFTASQKVYANELLNLIDPDGTYIQHRLFRESCLAVEGNFLKDLNVLNRDLSQTILVDNSPHAFGYQVDNGIPIESWFDDSSDKELLKLAKFLLDPSLKSASDVRPMIRNKFQCHKLIDKATPLSF